MTKGKLAPHVRIITASVEGILAKLTGQKETSQHNPVGFTLTWIAFVLAVIVLITSPLQAYRWAANPFPGFLIEQTLLLSSIGGTTWGSDVIGFEPLERLTHLNRTPIPTPDQFAAELSKYRIGDRISFQTMDQEGAPHLYEQIEIIHFPRNDLVRLFWLPYLIGLVYLTIAIWVYRVRGNTRAGRTFVVFCTLAMLVPVLVFDISTTHLWTPVYSIAIALLGGTLVSLSVIFPEELKSFYWRFWWRFVGYGISVLLIVWAMLVVNDQINPWAYVNNWRMSYSYMAVGLLVFVGVLFYRLRREETLVIRQQARIILWGAMMAFTPVVIWLLLPQIVDIIIPWNPIIFLPLLLIFPVAIGVAIVRYHMWDIDLIIRGTLAYTILTITLVLLYIGFVIGFGLVFGGVAQQNQAGIVIATLAIVAVANPLRLRIQALIDRRFYRRKYNAEQTLAAFGARLRHEVDLEKISDDLINVVIETMQPEKVSLWLLPRRVKSDTSEFNPKSFEK